MSSASQYSSREELISRSEARDPRNDLILINKEGALSVEPCLGICQSIIDSPDIVPSITLADR